MKSVASEKRFSWFLTAVLLGLTALCLAVILGSLYGFLSRTMDREYENEQKARQAEINLALRERLNLLESRTKEISLDNALRVNLMLGVRNQVAERALNLQPAAEGAHIFILDRKDRWITPQIQPPYLALAPFLMRLSFQSTPRRLLFHPGPMALPLSLFSAPIKRKEEVLGTVLTLYDLSRDRFFWNRFEEAWGGRLLLQTDKQLLDLKTLESESLPFLPRAGYRKALDLPGTHHSAGFYFVPLSDFPGLYYASETRPVEQAKRQVLLRLTGLCALVFLLTLFFSFAIVRRISEPLVDMARQAQRISTSPGDSHLDESTIRYEEFKTLARAFNTVLRGLVESRSKERASHHFLQGILNTVADPVYVLDEHNRFLLVNDAFCELFGLGKGQVTGLKSLELFQDQTARIFSVHDEPGREGETAWQREDWITPRQGEKRLFSTKRSRFQDPQTDRNVWVGVMRDITEAKRAEEELARHRDNLSQLVQERTAELRKANVQLRAEMEERVRAEKERLEIEKRLHRAKKMEALGTLAGGVAHDLNNILSGILSYPELLLMDLPPGSPLREPLATIQRSGRKAAAIVQDLLTLARRGVPVHETVKLNEVITEYLSSPEFRKLQKYHPEVRVIKRLQPNIPPIEGSSLHLSTALMNLVSNAAEAMTQGGDLTIALDICRLSSPVKGYQEVKEGDYVRLSVSDTGHGIEPEDLEKIFEPFYTKKKMGRSGTGLGMTVVWGTVVDHAGYIDVRSCPEKGTTFHLYFPAAKKSAVEAVLPQMSFADYRGAGQRVLVVDDVREQREIATAMLGNLGYNAQAAGSGEEALAILETHRFDLVILDMIMEPGMDGLETLKRILQANPLQRTILASGFSETDRVREARQLGARAYLKKPYTLEELARAAWAGFQS